MGFNKRIVDKNIILLKYREGVPLKEIFKADALIFLDLLSSKAFELYNNGYDDEYIINILENEK